MQNSQYYNNNNNQNNNQQVVPRNSTAGFGGDYETLQQIINQVTSENFDFFQQFINEICLNCITIVKNINRTATEKMDCIDWVVRNVEFFSDRYFLFFFNFLVCSMIS